MFYDVWFRLVNLKIEQQKLLKIKNKCGKLKEMLTSRAWKYKPIIPACRATEAKGSWVQTESGLNVLRSKYELLKEKKN